MTDAIARFLANLPRGQTIFTDVESAQVVAEVARRLGRDDLRIRGHEWVGLGTIVAANVAGTQWLDLASGDTEIRRI